MRDSNHRKQFGLDDTTSLRAFLRKQVGRGPLRAQPSWLEDYSGQINMDYIARFESLESGFREICSALRIKSVMLPHELKGSGENFREKFDDQSIQLISDVYAAEIDMFGYTFDNIDSV